MNMKIRFVRLEKSELIKEAIEDRVIPVLKKFKIYHGNNVHFQIEMENSPHQAGRDLFRVKVSVNSGEMRGFILEKSDINFYRALSSLSASLPANIKRFREKKMQKALNEKRRIKNAAVVEEFQLQYE